MQAVHRCAVGEVDHAFGGEAGLVGAEPQVDDGLDGEAGGAGPVGPVGRNLAGEPEPRGTPRRPPPVADGGGLERRGEAFGDRDRLPRHRPRLDGQRDGERVDCRPDAFPEGPVNASLDKGPIVMHAQNPKRDLGRLLLP
jgi:hypothetical protein